MATKDDDGRTRDEIVADVRADFSDEERSALIDVWVESVKVGRMPRSDYDKLTKDAIEAGLLNEAEAARGRAALD